MLPKDKAFEAQYHHKMEAIKEGNRQKIINDYRTRLMLYLADQDEMSSPVDSGFFDIELDNTEKNPIFESLPVNYFSEERIAVYTAVFGDSKEIIEPLTVPDNCDFYIFTDQEVPEYSVWEKMEFDFAAYDLADQSAEVKTGFFKLHPHLLFKDHAYSLYVDADIKVMTDPTEFIDRVNAYGVLLHDDYRVDCAYLETERCQVTGLISEEEAKQQRAYLEKQGLPKNYGFLDTAVIFRAHQMESCIELMEAWWQELHANVSQDPINLPQVLYLRDIRMLELAGLGKDLYSNYAFQKVNQYTMADNVAKFDGEVAT